jgi:plasmid stabilization system protein ParE
MRESETLGLSLSRRVEGDINAAADWYSLKSPRAASRFLLAVRQTLDLALRFPGLGTPVGKGLRRMQVSSFPFSVIYRVQTRHVNVLTIAHHRRLPELWSEA